MRMAGFFCKGPPFIPDLPNEEPLPESQEMEDPVYDFDEPNTAFPPEDLEQELQIPSVVFHYAFVSMIQCYMLKLLSSSLEPYELLTT